MNIGLYLDTLDFSIPSLHRFQTAILKGLAGRNNGRHNFIVLTWSTSGDLPSEFPFKVVTLRKTHRHLKKVISFTRWPVAAVLFLARLVGIGGGRTVDALNKWRRFEPNHYAQLRELDIDLVWLVTGNKLPTYLPFIRTVLDINHRIQPEYYWESTFEREEKYWDSLKRASFFITGTNEGKRQITSIYGIHEPRVKVIPFPTPLLPDSKDLPPMELGFKGPYVLYPARIWWHKNHVVALEALKILRDEWNITINLVFSGANGGNLDYVLKYARSLGVQDQLKCVGEVSLVELTALYKHAMALTYVSATGPDNLPPLEAMSVGCPAIVADVPGAREQYGDACLFFPPMDERALAGHIKFLLENASAREALVAKGFDRARKWTADDYGDEVLSLFDEFALIARSWGSSSAVFKYKA